MSTTDTPQIVSARTGKAPLFEAAHCGRCGGGGMFGPMSVNGGRCFGCGGHGYKLTKRGAAAQEFFTRLLSKATTELQPGDKIRDLGNPILGGAGWYPVESVKFHACKLTGSHGEQQADGSMVMFPSLSTGATIECGPAREGGYGLTLHGVALDTMHRVASTPEAKRDARDQALAYQATLTKTGTPRKRAAVAA